MKRHFVPLGEIAEIMGGYAFKSSMMSSEPKEFQIIKMSNLYQGSLDLSRNPSFWESIDAKTERYLLQSDDILMTLTGTVGKRDYGYTVQLRDEEKLLLNQRVCRIRPMHKKVDGFYLFQYLRTQEFLNKFFDCSIGGTGNQSNVGISDLRELDIYLPTVVDQKAIAALLSTWDEAIEKTEQLIVKKQKFYEAQLSKRLSLDVSERIKLKKFLKEVSKRNRDLSITQVLSVTNSKGFVRPEDQFDRQVASDNLSNYKIVSKGEYAYNPSRINVGSIARLDGWHYGVLSPMYTVFEIKKPSELHTDLFLHWLNSHEAKQRIRLSAQGSVRETVSFDDFCAIGFPKIDFKEQKALAEYFSLISAKIDTLKALSERYKTQKRGLMQKMLTGEWRVKPEIVKTFAE